MLWPCLAYEVIVLTWRRRCGHTDQFINGLLGILVRPDHGLGGGVGGAGGGSRVARSVVNLCVGIRLNKMKSFMF